MGDPYRKYHVFELVFFKAFRNHQHRAVCFRQYAVRIGTQDKLLDLLFSGSSYNGKVGIFFRNQVIDALDQASMADFRFYLQRNASFGKFLLYDGQIVFSQADIFLGYLIADDLFVAPVDQVKLVYNLKYGRTA